MKFRYPLQKIVDLKANEKSQAEWVLSQARHKLNREEEQLEHIHQDISYFQNQLSESAQSCMTISDLMVVSQYVSHLHQKAEVKQRDVRSAEREVLDRRNDLTDKMVDEKVWQTAKDKAYGLYAADQLKRQQNEMDELASVRHMKTAIK